MRATVRLAALVAALGSGSLASASVPADPNAAPHWCPPQGPSLPKEIHPDNVNQLRPGWVTLRMRVRPGAEPVTDVRVVSEAGGAGHAREWLPRVKKWVGCAANERDTWFDMKFTFGLQGNYVLPLKEGFSPPAFTAPRGAPALPAGDIGVGVCPIRATLVLRQPAAPNRVVELESQGGAPVIQWLERLVPDRSYMTPSPEGNRIDFDCKVDRGTVSFYDN